MEAYPEAPEPPDLTLSNRCKAMVQQFWELWSKQYLQSLQKSQKWHKELPNVKVGDLVMVLEESTLLTHWKTGKVTAVHPGEDGLVRAAEVLVPTAIFPSYHGRSSRRLDPKDMTVRSSTFKRPITKLAPLIAASPLELS